MRFDELIFSLSESFDLNKLKTNMEIVHEIQEIGTSLAEFIIVNSRDNFWENVDKVFNDKNSDGVEKMSEYINEYYATTPLSAMNQKIKEHLIKCCNVNFEDIVKWAENEWGEYDEADLPFEILLVAAIRCIGYSEKYIRSCIEEAEAEVEDAAEEERFNYRIWEQRTKSSLE